MAALEFNGIMVRCSAGVNLFLACFISADIIHAIERGDTRRWPANYVALFWQAARARIFSL